MTEQVYNSVVSDANAPLPLYFRIYERLVSEIRQGVYTAGDDFPSEGDLCKRFTVSRATVRSALRLLERDNLVLRRRGHKTICLYKPPEKQDTQALNGFVENLIAMGLQTEVEILASQFDRADSEIAKALRIQAGDRVHFAERVRSFEGVPFSFLTTHLPESVAQKCTLSNLGNKPLLSLLEDSGYIIGEAEQWISAIVADDKLARSLQVPKGSPLISLTRLVYDQTKAPIERLHACYRPDRYTFSLTLERERGVDAARWRPRG